jgi:alkanesulfonate monooxygenase SsuD/methylene tetrahydromethanopterin reductase-like flavin-dependent oxidoreductase (luciferase family)
MTPDLPARAHRGPKIALRYDLRSPAFGPGERVLYDNAIEQVAWADKTGCFDWILLTEHHGADDGYCPSPIVLASAMAARTERLRILFAALILPLHDPIRLAEDLSVLDIVSHGRVDAVFAGGYRGAEFEMFGRALRERPDLMERGIDMVRKAWTLEHFEVDGRRISVTPKPIQPSGPPILLGGNSPAACRRAARIGDGFFPGSSDPSLKKVYVEHCRKIGRKPRIEFVAGPMFLHLAHDPEAEWHSLARYAVHEASSYADWMRNSSGPDGVYRAAVDAATLRRSGAYSVLTPDECVSLLEGMDPTGTVVLSPLMGGMEPKRGWESLRLFLDEVAPRLERAPD